MKSRDNLRQWVLSRGVSHDDSIIGSKLVAAYVADCVRADRKDGLNLERAIVDFFDAFGVK